MLTDEEKSRYSRQLSLFGVEGQENLKKASVSIMGVGGLGSVVSLYLAAVGVGHIRLVDRDIVSLPDLNRQILYNMDDLGHKKVYRAAEKLMRMNPNVEIEPLDVSITEENVDGLIDGVDIVVDCLDNWATRLILNKACVKHQKILVHGGIQGLSGQVMVIIPGKTACLNCIIRGVRDEEGIAVLGTTASIIGSIQATETIKLITGIGKPAIGKIIYYDGYSMEFEHLEVLRSPNCEVCGSLWRHE